MVLTHFHASKHSQLHKAQIAELIYNCTLVISPTHKITKDCKEHTKLFQNVNPEHAHMHEIKCNIYIKEEI